MLCSYRCVKKWKLLAVFCCGFILLAWFQSPSKDVVKQEGASRANLGQIHTTSTSLHPQLSKLKKMNWVFLIFLCSNSGVLYLPCFPYILQYISVGIQPQKKCGIFVYTFSLIKFKNSHQWKHQVQHLEVGIMAGCTIRIFPSFYHDNGADHTCISMSGWRKTNEDWAAASSNQSVYGWPHNDNNSIRIHQMPVS